MKRMLLATALATLMLSGTAQADRGERDKHHWKEVRKAQHEAWKDRREATREYAKDRREADREYWKDRREVEREYARDQREYRRWARGQYIPRTYLVERYHVRDYDAYGLAPPPRGYVYVRPYEQDETVYLVQLATGLISTLLGR